MLMLLLLGAQGHVKGTLEAALLPFRQRRRRRRLGHSSTVLFRAAVLQNSLGRIPCLSGPSPCKALASYKDSLTDITRAAAARFSRRPISASSVADERYAATLHPLGLATADIACHSPGSSVNRLTGYCQAQHCVLWAWL